MKSDNDLIRAFRHGDAGAFEALYTRYRDRVFFYALTLRGDHHGAEETVQEAFMVFLERIETYEPKGSFKSYLFASVRSRAIDGLRKSNTRHEILQAEAMDLFETPRATDSFQDREVSRVVSRALLDLPREQREVVALKIYDGMTFSEIAGITGVSENTAASRYRYALEKLKNKLEGIRKDG